MFERTEHRDEEHVDERAWNFFSWSYGRGNTRGWDSTKEGIRPTATLGSGNGFRACAYCGRQALPIQERKYSHRTGQDEYISKGHCCVCKDAMDEVDMMVQIDIITKQFKSAISKCHQAMPKTNPEILFALVDKQHEEKKKSLRFWNNDGRISPHSLNDFNMNLKGSRYNDDDDEEYE